MKPVKVGVLGLGTVGSGTVNVLKRNAQEISRRTGREMIITRAAVSDLTRKRLCDTQDIMLSTDIDAIINDPEIEIILELTGATSVVKDLALQAIANGKHLITANKALIALHGNEIFAAASKANTMVAYEATVAGGIPIIKAIREGLSGNQINWLAGIINGTSNFILTAMCNQHRNFAEALKEAKRLGYAEADPTFDIAGIDAGHKLMILASIAFGMPLQFENVFTEGITKITRTDIKYAEELGYRIKHLGIARKTAKGIELRVHPTLIPKHCLMANVDGVMNAVLVQANALGPSFYYGAGAGADATASAVIADVIDVVRTLTLDIENRVPYLGFQEKAIINPLVLPHEAIETSYYLRLTVADRLCNLADISNILAAQNIHIKVLIQKESQAAESRASIIMLTQKTIEKEMNIAIAAIENLAFVTEQVTCIRLETLEE